jgi:hypothetical protein
MRKRSFIAFDQVLVDAELLIEDPNGSLKLAGVDYECLDSSQLDELARRFEAMKSSMADL